MTNIRPSTERPHRQAAHLAVEAGFSVFSKMRDDRDVSVRISAAFVMATFIERREDTSVRLCEAIDGEIGRFLPSLQTFGSFSRFAIAFYNFVDTMLFVISI